MSCKQCRHYSFYQMITQGPYGYSGYIPCEYCSRFSMQEDNFEPIQGYRFDAETYILEGIKQ